MAFFILAVMAIAVPDGRQIVQASLIAAFNPAASVCSSPRAVCTLAILINMSLFYFNLLPIPPLDGSRVLRNMLPYRAVQFYDRINIWVAYILMIFVGGYILQILLAPSLRLIYSALISL